MAKDCVNVLGTANPRNSNPPAAPCGAPVAHQCDVPSRSASSGGGSATSPEPARSTSAAPPAPARGASAVPSVSANSVPATNPPAPSRPLLSIVVPAGPSGPVAPEDPPESQVLFSQSSSQNSSEDSIGDFSDSNSPVNPSSSIGSFFSSPPPSRNQSILKGVGKVVNYLRGSGSESTSNVPASKVVSNIVIKISVEDSMEVEINVNDPTVGQGCAWGGGRACVSQ